MSQIYHALCQSGTREQGGFSGLLFHVSLQMIGQMVLPRKRLVTLIALVRFFSSVRSHVCRHIAGLELIATNIALFFKPKCILLLCIWRLDLEVAK